MAYVLLFAPPEFCAIPKYGMIQFHPSLLPLHRGPSSIPWAIIRGRSETGLSIFRPTPGLDEGPVILQKHIAIGPDDTAGSLYFDKIFPMGVEALVEAADLVVKGRAIETTQDESRATYEGWVRDAESRINWASHVDFIYDLIRGCNPAPGAWTMHGEQKLYLFDAKKIPAATFGAVRGQKDRRGRLGRPRGAAHPGAGRLRRGLAGAARHRRQDRRERGRHRRRHNPRRLRVPHPPRCARHPLPHCGRGGTRPQGRVGEGVRAAPSSRDLPAIAECCRVFWAGSSAACRAAWRVPGRSAAWCRAARSRRR